MDQEKLKNSLELIAGSIDTGYSAVYTYAVKEILDTQERQQLAAVIRYTANNLPKEFSQSYQVGTTPSEDKTLRH